MVKYYLTENEIPVEVDLVDSFGFKKYIIYEPGKPGHFYRLNEIPKQWSGIEKKTYDRKKYSLLNKTEV